MYLLISISQLVLIVIAIFIANNSVIEDEDTIPQKYVSMKFTVTRTLTSSTLTHSASHFYVLVSVFLPLNVCFTVQLNFVGVTALFVDYRKILRRGYVNDTGFWRCEWF